jgi:hypothetical protein
MQTLRQAQLLARLVLAWFVLALGVAVASPLVQPQALELVCSSAGAVKLVQVGDDGAAASTHLLDCPLCLTGSAPPPAVPSSWTQALPPAHALPALAAPMHAGRTAAPPPSRGPPSQA